MHADGKEISGLKKGEFYGCLYSLGFNNLCQHKEQCKQLSVTESYSQIPNFTITKQSGKDYYTGMYLKQQNIVT